MLFVILTLTVTLNPNPNPTLFRYIFYTGILYTFILGKDLIKARIRMNKPKLSTNTNPTSFANSIRPHDRAPNPHRPTSEV